jgi:hypothetical protein
LLIFLGIVIVVGIWAIVMERRGALTGRDAREDRFTNPGRATSWRDKGHGGDPD